MRVIDAYALKKRIEQMKKYDNQKRILIKDVLNAIDDASRFSRIDEEVTRCQNCRYWYRPFCLVTGQMQSGNFYCAHGRRRL